MAQNKTLNARISWKRDTSANWTSQDPVLLNGEIIIVDTASGETRFKIGDGTKKYSQLPFEDEVIRNLIGEKAKVSIETWADATSSVSVPLDELVINKVANSTVYQAMKDAGKIDNNELYLVEGDGMEIEAKLTSGTPIAEVKVDGTVVETIYAPAVSDDIATKSYVDTKVANLVDSAPETLNTLDELAAALGDDQNFANTVTTELGKKANSADLATVATSGKYSDLSGTPTIPTVNNATLTIQKNGTNVATFTANSSTNATANITVPTKVSELTNDSGFTANTGTITKVQANGTDVTSSGTANIPAASTSAYGVTKLSSSTSSTSTSLAATPKAVYTVKNEALQAAVKDWDQSDSTKTDYIKNRPFYLDRTITSSPETYETDGSTSTYYSIDLGSYAYFPWLDGDEVAIDVQVSDGDIKRFYSSVTTEYHHEYYDNFEYIREHWNMNVPSEDLSITLSHDYYTYYDGTEDENYWSCNINHNFTKIEKISIYQMQSTLKKIDDIYLPLASQIRTGIVQLIDSTSSYSTTTAATPYSVKRAYDLANAANTAAENAQATADGKANDTHSHAISEVTNLQSSLDAKVPTSRTVNGKALSSDISLTASDVGAATQNTWYGTCSTAANTADKVVATSTGNFTLTTGNIVYVLFTNAAYTGSTLNVDGTGAVTIKVSGTSNVSTYQWGANEAVGFVYDGTNFRMLDGMIATTTYYGMTKLSSSTSSTSTTTAATPSAVKSAYDRAATMMNRSTNVNAADTNYTTLMARGLSLNSADTTPAVNGAIAWTYK